MQRMGQPIGSTGARRAPIGAILRIVSALRMVTWCHHKNLKMYSSAFFGGTFGPKMTSLGIKKRQIGRSLLKMARINLDQKTAPP